MILTLKKKYSTQPTSRCLEVVACWSNPASWTLLICRKIARWKVEAILPLQLLPRSRPLPSSVLKNKLQWLHKTLRRGNKSRKRSRPHHQRLLLRCSSASLNKSRWLLLDLRKKILINRKRPRDLLSHLLRPQAKRAVRSLLRSACQTWMLSSSRFC